MRSLMSQIATAAFLLATGLCAIAQPQDGSEVVVDKSQAQAIKDLKNPAGDNGSKGLNGTRNIFLTPGENDPLPTPPPQGRVPSSLVKMGDGKYYSKHAFVLDKSTRTLSVWRNNRSELKFMGAYPSDMGQRSGDKMVLGDKKTPEGVYFFQHRYDRRMLDFNEYGLRAFTMDYPNFFDRIERKTGSGIWMHSIPEKKSLRRGSRGCVVVRNDVIMALSEFIDLTKTPIVVEEKVQWVDGQTEKVTRDRIMNWLNSWVDSWSGKKLDQYISHYDESFSSGKYNLEKWRGYKKYLNEHYKYINVKVEKPTIYRHKDEWIIRFLQRYESDNKADFGEKFLYLKEREGGQLKIVGEQWKALSTDLVAFESH